MPSDLIELAAGLAMLAPPLLIMRSFAKRNARERDARWASFTQALAASGFVARPDASPAQYGFRGRVGDVPIAIEHFDVQHRMNQKTTTQRRLAYRVEAPSRFGRLGVYRRLHVPVAELGAMQEVPLPPELGRYRAFAELPGDAAHLVGPALIELLRRDDLVASLETTSGALVLTLLVAPSEPTATLRLAELLASLQEGRTPSPAPVLPQDEGWTSAWFAVGCLPLVLASVLGLPLSYATPVHGLVSPLVCDEGTTLVALERNTDRMQCVDERGVDREPAHVLPYLTGASLIYYPTLLLAFFWGRGAELRRRRSASVSPAARPGPYR